MKYLRIILSILLSINMVGCSKNIYENGNNEFMKIIHLDCGRKYFSVESIKLIIDAAKEGNKTHVQLALGNDGCRFLLNDMSIEINDIEYSSEQIKNGIHIGNEVYADFEVDELTETEMDEILNYANEKNIEIIPLINTPGHMDSILSCMKDCGVENASYHASIRTIDVSNKDAVQFSQAILQKYINYFSSKGCNYFSIGADEYANDIYTKGGMGFEHLINNNEYGLFIEYVNECASLVKNSGMIPMVFNDGIYYENNTEFGTFDKDLLICYWSNGWWGYKPASAKRLEEYGFDLINTNSSYYWVLGNEKWQCSKSKIEKFNVNKFKGSTIKNPQGAMFCIWCDEPFGDTDINVVEKTRYLIINFCEER